ncbi:hypothetical protein V500_02958 [Pseudogymnoascus sp. VKM F-4518 (FW-2643)]|nr:hypothetical protein V500_02958 [Pseudogymnoascus sp. VKM F-4518 (FW-2643)]
MIVDRTYDDGKDNNTRQRDPRRSSPIRAKIEDGDIHAEQASSDHEFNLGAISESVEDDVHEDEGDRTGEESCEAKISSA